MSQARIAAVAALAGATGMLVVSGVPVQIFVFVGEWDPELTQPCSFTGQMLFGGVCAALLACGVIGAAYHLIQPTSMARMALVCGAIAFGIASLSIAWGNTRVAMATSELLSSANGLMEPFIRGCQSGLLPMRIGYSLVLAASGFVLVAVFATPMRKDSRRAPLGTVALIVSVLASLLLVTGNVLAVFPTWRLHEFLIPNDPPGVDWVGLATCLSRIVLNVYAVSLAIAGLALACLLLAFSRGRPVTPVSTPTGNSE